jgi:hypothetical protein
MCWDKKPRPIIESSVVIRAHYASFRDLRDKEISMTYMGGHSTAYLNSTRHDSSSKSTPTELSGFQRIRQSLLWNISKNAQHPVQRTRGEDVLVEV